ncbi:MAG TPA: enoyl-CoA hydratase/isomerase family protein [Candidatus Binataceae bacterium]|nr:enoyl-CoA hydratase/isomerase family protein [Candidatus Binataceae bacterium]
MYQTFEYGLQDGVGLVRLNRPNKLNAIDAVMVREFGELVAAVRADRNVRVLVFTGNGRAFCAGADIANLNRFSSGGEFMSFIEALQVTFNLLEDLDRPTIAAVNGLALGGGCELALSCDFRIMAEDASIGVPEILIGVLPGAGGTQRLSKMLPPAIAKQMIYFGEPLKSSQALSFGLVNAVVPSAQVLETAMEWARRLLKQPPLAVRAAKMLVHAGINADQKTGVEAERLAMAFLFGTEDRAEGMGAFLAKRGAEFKGK